MIYIQYDFKPGYIVKDEDIKNFKNIINKYPLIIINNKIDPLIIQELFLNYSVYGLSTHKKIIVIETILNIYKNKEFIELN